MAEIVSASGSKRLPTRVDLTPMVDLGFLLITFFVFTTTMSQANSMKLNLPDDRSPDSAQAAASKTLSLLLGENKLYYYNGQDIEEGRSISYSSSGIREVIEDKRRSVIHSFGDAKEMVVLIKPTPSASYKDLVDILDEMTISDVRRYVLMDPGSNELLWLSERK